MTGRGEGEKHTWRDREREKRTEGEIEALGEIQEGEKESRKGEKRWRECRRDEQRNKRKSDSRERGREGTKD